MLLKVSLTDFEFVAKILLKCKHNEIYCMWGADLCFIKKTVLNFEFFDEILM